MRISVMAFLFCLTSTIANAQDQIYDMTKPLKCSTVDNVFNYFKDNFQEKPIWVGKTTTGTYITLMSNKESKTWTLVEYDVKFACVLGAGETSSDPNI